MSRRVVVEVRENIHKELRKTAVLNDLKLHVLANALLEDRVFDRQYMEALIKRLKVEGGTPV
jgi:hypothetical protein